MLLAREMRQTKLVEKIKPQILCRTTFFPRKSYRYWDNVDKYGRGKQNTNDNISYGACAASSVGRGKLTYFVYFPWRPLEAELLIEMFCFFFTRDKEPLFLIFMLVIIRWFPREITEHQTLVSTIFNWDLAHKFYVNFLFCNSVQPEGGYVEVAETCSCDLWNICCVFHWLSPFQ